MLGADKGAGRVGVQKKTNDDSPGQEQDEMQREVFWLRHNKALRFNCFIFVLVNILLLPGP